MRLSNELHSCVIVVNDMDVCVRAFSHIAKHPKEVKEWVPINLKELGDTMVFDKRTCEIMQHKDIEFIIDKKKLQFIVVREPIGHLDE